MALRLKHLAASSLRNVMNRRPGTNKQSAAANGLMTVDATYRPWPRYPPDETAALTSSLVASSPTSHTVQPQQGQQDLRARGPSDRSTARPGHPARPSCVVADRRPRTKLRSGGQACDAKASFSASQTGGEPKILGTGPLLVPLIFTSTELLARAGLAGRGGIRLQWHDRHDVLCPSSDPSDPTVPSTDGRGPAKRWVLGVLVEGLRANHMRVVSGHTWFATLHMFWC